MAGKSSSIKKPATTSVRREDRRRIPLTALTLLTVPEDPMLSIYLRSLETIDMSMADRMAGATLDRSVSFRSASDSSRTDLRRSSHATEAMSSELELDKFIASLTAKESPDAVIRTIMGRQELKHCRN